MPKRSLALGCFLLAVVTAWFLWRMHLDADRKSSPSEMRGAVLMGSPSASPFSSVSTLVESTKVSNELSGEPPVLADKKVPLVIGRKTWRFEPLAVGQQSVGKLYAQIAEHPIDGSNVDVVATFAEAMTRCRQRDHIKRVTHQRRDTFRAEAERQILELNEKAVDKYLAMCSDAPSDAAARSDQWLNDAARLGDGRARYMYASGLHLAWINDISALNANNDLTVQYTSKVLEYLHELAAQGHYDSLQQLSILYMSPANGNDPARSWAYATAASRARGDLWPQYGMQQRFEKLSTADRARAEKEAQAIFEQCCR